jgi:hypothetical protein
MTRPQEKSCTRTCKATHLRNLAADEEAVVQRVQLLALWQLVRCAHLQVRTVSIVSATARNSTDRAERANECGDEAEQMLVLSGRVRMHHSSQASLLALPCISDHRSSHQLVQCTAHA